MFCGESDDAYNFDWERVPRECVALGCRPYDRVSLLAASGTRTDSG
jgi:hypothetical protein